MNQSAVDPVLHGMKRAGVSIVCYIFVRHVEATEGIVIMEPSEHN